MKSKLYFEAFSNDKDKLIEILNKTFEEVSKFKNFQIIDKKIADPITRDIKTPDGKTINVWSSYLEIYADFKDFDSLIDFVLFYTPSRIDIEDIKEMKIITKDKEIKYNKEQINLLLNRIPQAINTKISALLSIYLAQIKKNSKGPDNQSLTNLKIK
ncbi:hypothetical protein Nst1_405 [Candidatus Nanobsidianus stetteri]|uniref:Uncharacterized protein n=1 Tax=Nanobsidianus stetteri TaxID=1294122 RepID=R1E4R1_NANST|nr:hypothetical protein Nst1_405 [Candidatus Nanobsidianus stetteri]